MQILSGWHSWLHAHLTPGLGPAGWRKILALGGPEQVYSRPVAQLTSIFGNALTQALLDPSRTESARAATTAWLAKDTAHHALLTLADSAYPNPLRHIPDPPPLLFLHGQLRLLDNSMLAIVGSRNSTAQGVLDAQHFAHALSENDLTVVSGLARGIDAAAHAGALKNPSSTIAVMGTGIEQTYPRHNLALRQRIAADGLIISEYPLGTPPLARHFPQRNRIIAGLTRGCLVIEASARSGSLITARLAAEYGREVFALPGSIHAPLAQGAHYLIREGATLVSSVADILHELAWPTTVLLSTPATPAIPSPLLDLLINAPMDIESLSIRTGLTPEALYAILLPLELNGQVALLPGGQYQCALST